jgi:Outer membrane lipoprotein-sorting protein
MRSARMRQALLTPPALLAALLSAGAAAPNSPGPPGPPSAQEMVAAADRIRNPPHPFRLTDTLVEYREGKPRDRVVLVVYAREDQSSHQFNNLVRYVDPPRDEGKMVLLHGTDMWFYDPASKASVRISPQQRLLGQASDGDVVTANLARDYTAALVGPETVLDAEHQERHCWHLDMAAATSEAVYSRVEYWLEQGSYRPVKGKYYSDSGRLLKIAYFHRFETELGAERPTESIIIDAVNSNLVTTMTTSDYRDQEIPDAWFQRDYLPRLKVE